MPTLRDRVLDREPTVGTWLSLGSPAVAELLATQPFDFLLADMEHTDATAETITAVLRAVDAADGDTETIVRLPSTDRSHVTRVLDAGASGLMVPMIHTAEEARAFAERARYPPAGVRGIAAGRAAGYGQRIGSYMASADEEIVTVVQIESQRGLENVGNIAAVEPVDALFVGPADLSAALGGLGEYEDPAFTEAIDRILDAAHAQDVPVGTLATAGTGSAHWVEAGFDFVVAGIDAEFLADGAEAARTAFENAVDG
jgi:2-keto-3-deoxy-L-rhamnonate aldolase RhmA